MHALEFDTPLSGWTAEVYVSDEMRHRLPGWGDPVAEFDTSDSGTALGCAEPARNTSSDSTPAAR